jgi:hypothetical protein
VNSIRRGLLASTLGMGMGYPSRENDDEEDMDDSDGEGEGDDDDDGEEQSQEDGGEDEYASHLSRLRHITGNNGNGSERERERAERAALRRRQNQVSDILGLGLAGSNIGERFGLALAAGGVGVGGGIPVAPAAGGLGGLHHHHANITGERERARRSLDNSGSLIPLRSDVNSDLILRQAQENSCHFQPQWSASHCGRSVMVDSDKGLVACLTENSDAGRCVRTQDPLPGVVCAAPRDDAQDPPAAAEYDYEEAEDQNNYYGWKIMFEHPTREKGRSMGGCYLLGVTTERFDSFTSRSGLQQSKLFWGIEDGGRRYEGNGNAAAASANNDNENEASENQEGDEAEDGQAQAQAQANSNATAASMIQLNRAEAPRNSENVLFGSKEVITIVADMNASAGKLHFWRDGRFIGTLVSNLPANVPLYPVAVPFNSGVCVTITGLSETSPAVA